MGDRGLCDLCNKPCVMFKGSWVCTSCGAEREHDPEHDETGSKFPPGYWRQGGSKGPDRRR